VNAAVSGNRILADATSIGCGRGCRAAPRHGHHSLTAIFETSSERIDGVLRRRTKIVATLGPATDAPGVLDQLVAAGMSCARLNCSHGTPDDQRRRAGEVRAAAQRAGRPVGLLFDLQGPKMRLSAHVAQRTLAAGDTV